ncbi:MAG: 2-oxoglutarate and iron-dependent oxygenase domain-containing protein [Candidatus Poseidoniaceae archaeon]|jgi:isopenicillin N synthase-like dioxygenase|nr:2-oxoglutarate and iron-dependent oxygenase domain-containing protein [Candidatus Poseidoniaceae archaeon]
MARELEICDLRNWVAGGNRREQFVQKMGDSLRDIGFFALTGHGIPITEIDQSYDVAEEFFNLDQTLKSKYEQSDLHRQRGYTPYGVEHAKDNPAPDLKEFWQTGRTVDNPDFLTNIWPSEVQNFEKSIDGLFLGLEKMSLQLLSAASLYLGKNENWLPEMTELGNTILRVIHYPALGENVPKDAVRSAQHEDINLITLLVGATADGLQVMDHDGTWIDVEGNHEHIIVDSGDMLQSLTNGLFKSTTHRVVNPPDAQSDRYSMPMFVHPRNEIDLTPLPEFIELTGGKALYPPITAGEYLHQRLVEIGLAN